MTFKKLVFTSGKNGSIETASISIRGFVYRYNILMDSECNYFALDRNNIKINKKGLWSKEEAEEVCQKHFEEICNVIMESITA